MQRTRVGLHNPNDIPQAPTRSAWLGFLPVSALEDNLNNLNIEAEEAQEVDEDDNSLVFTFDDIPLVFNSPRHIHQDQTVELMMQVIVTQLNYLLSHI